MADPRRKSKKKRSAIVPRAVFAASVALGTVPALPGCGSSTMVDAGSDFGFAVAAPVDMGTGDLGRDAAAGDASAPDAGMDSGVFAVAVPVDLGTSDAPVGVDRPIFAVAVPIDF